MKHSSEITRRSWLRRSFAAPLLGASALSMGVEGAYAARVKPASKPMVKIVVVQSGFIQLDNKELLAFAKQCNVKTIQDASVNPLCCTWICPLSVDKRLTGEHFILVHYGYTLIYLTSPSALNLLTRRFVKEGITGEMPVGLMTSFDVR